MAELKFDAQKLGTVAVLIIVVLVGLGVYNRVTALEAQVTRLEIAVDQLADVQAQLTEVNLEMSKVRADLADIAGARDQILSEMCAILHLAPERCGVRDAA